MNRPILLFSGGVDSTACLQLMKNETPILFYFETLKLRNKTPIIRKIAKKISPYSPFYTFRTETMGYKAIYFGGVEISKSYGITMVEEDGNYDHLFYPAEFNRKVSIGYFKKTPTRTIIKKIRKITPKKVLENNEALIIPNGQDFLIKKLQCFPKVYDFPIKDMKLFEIDEIVNELPNEIKQLIQSSTRPYYPQFIPTIRPKIATISIKNIDK